MKEGSKRIPINPAAAAYLFVENEWVGGVGIQFTTVVCSTRIGHVYTRVHQE